ncbi:MAG: KH domain-containing protein [Clostridia bacterium]|nr:KH domain-containing protein [Clostridia bacterium]
MKSFEFTGKTIEKAIATGLEELGKKQEDVDIQILSEGGFFKKAKVVISFEDEVLKTNFAKQPPKVEEAKEEKVEEKKPEIAKEPKKEEHVQKVETHEVKVEKVEQPKEEPKKEEKQAPKAKDNNAPKSQEEIEEKRDASEVVISTEDAGKVIGHRGEGLSAIQYLANIIETAHKKNAKRVVVDAGDYKQKREETLRALAIRVAGKVEATGRPYKLDPMNAFERRIVHTELHNYASVETHSEGVEPFRRIIVTKKK